MYFEYIFTSITLEALQYHRCYKDKKGDRITAIKKFLGLHQTVVNVTYLKTLNH